ncbi:DNA-formamidopyrimidine glycosylase, partial [Xanthomonas citri pv. citri]|nr:DNA-formamidopyrimidine glycosylase [Xanthomonas citri pv. citri]
MPELPEVETVRRTLTGLVKGKTIKSVEIRWPNIIKRPAEPE